MAYLNSRRSMRETYTSEMVSIHLSRLPQEPSGSLVPHSKEGVSEAVETRVSTNLVLQLSTNRSDELIHWYVDQSEHYDGTFLRINTDCRDPDIETREMEARSVSFAIHSSRWYDQYLFLHKASRPLVTVTDSAGRTLKVSIGRRMEITILNVRCLLDM